MRCQTCNGVVGDEERDVVRRVRPFGAEPVRGPVERAEKGARRHGRIGVPQLAALDAVGDDGAHAALVAIALGDNRHAQARWQGVDLEVRGRSFDFVQQASHVRRRHLVQPLGERAGAIAPHLGERLEQPIERSVLAKEEDLVLAAEVVIQVARRQVGGNCDLAHAGGGKTAGAEYARSGAHDLDPPVVGAD
jgi:hypothetical protein